MHKIRWGVAPLLHDYLKLQSSSTDIIVGNAHAIYQLCLHPQLSIYVYVTPHFII